MRAVILAALAGLALGWAAGRLRHPAEDPPAPAASCEEQAAPAPTRCRSVRRALEACERELVAADPTARPEDPAAGRRLALPAEPIEDRWREAFAACDAPGEIVSTSCREPPCVAAVRPTGDGTSEDLRDALETCGAFEPPEDGDSEVVVMDWPVTCPGGVEETMVIVAQTEDMAEAGTELLPEADRDDSLFEAWYGAYYGLGLVGARAAELAARWPCGD